MGNLRALGRVAPVATFLALLAASASAEIAGTGTFDIGVNVGLTTSFDGMIFFATGARTVLGQPVDLAADVGDMSYEGTAQVDLATRSASFALTAGPALTASQLEFDASGVAACDATGCLNGQATFAGTFDRVDDPTNVLPDATYTFDGTIYVSSGPSGGSGGTFGINAFEPRPTAAIPDGITASGPTLFFDSVQGIPRGFEASVRFPKVTSGGTTTFVAFSALPGDIPAGYELVDEISVFIDVVTSSVVFTGDAEVCIGVDDADSDGVVDGTGIAIADLRVLHAVAAGQAFVDVTSPSTLPRVVCGTSPGLSPFVVARRSSGGGSTTTTTLPNAACTDPVACIQAAEGAALCGAEAINPRLDALIARKLGVAKAALTQAASSPATRAAKLVKKARKQLTKIGRRADAFAGKKNGGITPECRESIHGVLDAITAALDAHPPTGAAGSGGPF